MTKQEYETFNNYDFLTEEDKEKQRELPCFISDKQLLTLIRKHKTARRNEDYSTMSCIEYRLTAINFHYEVGLLWRGNYEELLRGRK